ncbi:DEAD/DEAH box helicase family protein [Candidatus Woesearchaeota archaeon]|nr:DEAD/DEAH box helicase family protein [Candidatus Woesearchaeota archaeon]
MSLINLKNSLKYKYKRLNDDIVRNFLVPCLKESTFYDRAVGFFSSASLKMALEGLRDFILKEKSEIRLITSPYLSYKDIEEIEKGLREKKIVYENEILKEINKMEEDGEINLLAQLSWLISHNKLKIRIASMESSNVRAMFHDKLGIFTDEDKNQVVFYGSLNDSYNAYAQNYDAIRVITSWGDEAKKVDIESRDFETLWRGKELGVLICEVSEAIQQKIVKYLPKNEMELLQIIQEYERQEKIAKSKPNPTGLRPWKFQQICISSVIKNDFRGLIKMATGTGKTATTFFCILEFIEKIKAKGNRIIIVVPSIELIEQWYEFLKNNISTEDYLFKYYSKTKKDQKNHINFLWEKEEQNVFLIITIGSLKNCPQLKRKVDFIIADEVHAFGTENHMQALKSIHQPQYRLGLSATPERYYDEDGTKKIFSYFGDIIFEFDISDAQKEEKEPGMETVLCNYFYDFEVSHLTHEEQKKLDALNIKIGREVAINEEIGFYELNENNKLKNLIMKRARLLKLSLNKLESLRYILLNHPDKLNQCIVYCEDTDQLNLVKNIFNETGISSYIEYHSFIPKREESLDIFRDKNIKFILSMHCLDQGIDIPDCDSLILLSSSGNPREYIQRRGRVLRNKPGKGIVNIFDIVTLPISPSSKDKGLIMAQFLRIWEFIKRSSSPEAKLKIRKYLSMMDVSEEELDAELNKW